VYVYTSATATIGNAPTNTTYWTLITQGIRYRGTYTNGTAYLVNDVVINGQNTYIVTGAHTATQAANLETQLTIIALGQQGLPNQSGNSKKFLSTDGTNTSWASTAYLDMEYVGDNQGNDAKTFETNATISDALGIFAGASNDFTQLATINTTNASNASNDFIAYTADGNNTDGWIDMGIASRTFSSATYGITGPHDGYIFMSAPRGTTHDITKKKIVGSTATVTTGNAHGYTTGNAIVIEGVDSTFNGKHTITSTTSTTISFATTASPISEVNVSPFGSVHKPYGNGNLVFATDGTGLSNSIVFAAGGYDSGTTQMTIVPNTTVNVAITTAATSATTGALTVAGGVGITGSTWTDGNIYVGGTLYSGNNTALSWGQNNLLTGVAGVIEVTSSSNTYGQIAFHNTDSTSSVDFIAYPNNGNDTHGWIDMGMTGSAFSQTTYGITGPNDGYIFVDAPVGSTGYGNLVLATGAQGTRNRIVFAAGGFASGRTQMEIIPDTSVKINIATPSTSATTGALVVTGGVGITGDVNVAGNITFGGTGTNVSTANLAVNAPIVFTGSGSIVGTNDLGLVTESKYSVGAYNSISNPYGIPGVATLYAGSGVTAPNYIVNKQLTSNVATLVTYYAHPFVVGDSVTIASVDSVFNGTYTITVIPNSTSFSYAKTNADIASARIGDQTFSINQKSLVSNVATLQTTANHTYTIGQTVVVSGVDSTFNGTYTITAVTANSFNYAKTSINVSATTVSPVGTAVVNTSASTVVISSATRTRWSAWSKSAASVPAIGEQGTWNLVSNISTLPVTNINLAQATYGVLDVQYDLIKVGGITLQGGLNSGSFVLTGNITAPAWTTSGIHHVANAFTATDTTSTGTVANAYSNSYGTTTVAAINTGVTYTNYATINIAAPVAGTNVTITNPYSLISQGNVLINGTTTHAGNTTFSSTNTFTGYVNFSGGSYFTGTTDVQEVREQTVDVTSSDGGTTWPLDWSAGNVYNISSPNANMTFNLTNVPTDNSKVMTINCFVTQGSTGYIPTTFRINGSSQTIRWGGGSNPTPTNTSGKIDIFNFTMMRTSGGSWNVFASSSTNF
jgi:hypothetical protein